MQNKEQGIYRLARLTLTRTTSHRGETTVYREQRRQGQTAPQRERESRRNTCISSTPVASNFVLSPSFSLSLEAEERRARGDRGGDKQRERARGRAFAKSAEKRSRRREREDDIINCDHARRNNRIMGETEDYTRAKEPFLYLSRSHILYSRDDTKPLFHAATGAATAYLTVLLYISRRDIVLRRRAHARNTYFSLPRTNTRICSLPGGRGPGSPLFAARFPFRVFSSRTPCRLLSLATPASLIEFTVYAFEEFKSRPGMHAGR